jgi:hypothetical protein
VSAALEVGWPIMTWSQNARALTWQDALHRVTQDERTLDVVKET